MHVVYRLCSNRRRRKQIHATQSIGGPINISISTLINFIIVSNVIRPFKKNLDECANKLQAADGESLDAKSLADLFGAAPNLRWRAPRTAGETVPSQQWGGDVGRRGWVRVLLPPKDEAGEKTHAGWSSITGADRRPLIIVLSQQ
jgi:hypothetical protein